MIAQFTSRIAIFITIFIVFVHTALALEPVFVFQNDLALDITQELDSYESEEDRLQISTAPDANGVVRRVEVRAQEKSEASFWSVFALANKSHKQIDRLLVAPHYRMSESGLFWPDLGAARIVGITPSEGFSLERRKDSENDIFLITLDPGTIITFVVEKKSKKLPKLYLWEPDAYKNTVDSYTLYRGIVLGVAGLLAIFLSILLVLKGSMVFPATACLAWGVLVYLVLNFGFWNKITAVSDDNLQFWRASTEIFLAAGLIVFLYAYLNLNRWNTHYTSVSIAWLLGLLVLFGVATIEPSMAAGIARFSFALTVIAGFFLILVLSFLGSDRAVMLIPAWILLAFWVVSACLTVTGHITNDMIEAALSGGMVLIVLLMGFVVMQQAFSDAGLAQGPISDVERKALALIGSDDMVWDWDINRDVIYTGTGVAQILQVPEKNLSGSPEDWLNNLHSGDRDRFRIILDTVLENRCGRILQDLRLRAQDGRFLWFRLKARPILGVNGTAVRCIGTIADINSAKNVEECLLRDSVRDHFTGLDNRELFVNRLNVIMTFAAQDFVPRPSVFHINIDGFLKINSEFGYWAGNMILLTIVRRLKHLLKKGDTLLRFHGDQFVLLLSSKSEPKKIALFASLVQKNMNAPIRFDGQEIVLSCSIGISTWHSEYTKSEQMMRDARIAMYQSRKTGNNKIEPFRPIFREGKLEDIIMEKDLHHALKRNEFNVIYQPIIRLQDRSIAGFEPCCAGNTPSWGKCH